MNCHPSIVGWTVDEVADCLPGLPNNIKATLRAMPATSIGQCWSKLVREEQFAINRAAQAMLSKYGEMQQAA